MAETATTAANQPASAEPPAELVDKLSELITVGASPGESEGLDPAQRRTIAALALAPMMRRRPGEAEVRLDRHGEAAGAVRRMTLVISNDDMPFLVDSISLAITSAGLEIKRLLHPVIDVHRSTDGSLIEIAAAGPSGAPPAPGAYRESLIYVEVERAPGAVRNRLLGNVENVLSDVRASVSDWAAMVAAIRDTARRLANNPAPVATYENAEDVAFLEWLLDDNFTILGYRGYRLEGEAVSARLVADRPGLGLLRDPSRRIWLGADPNHPEPVDRMMERARALLVAKTDLVSTVHRRVNCDYISVKRFDEAGRVVGEDQIVGLFTSRALNEPPRNIPLVRRRVSQISADLGFDPRGHNGKALTHVLESFPREELFQVPVTRLKDMALGLLSLLDRPRPKLFVRTDPFGRRVSVLAYIPRDAYTSEVRVHVGRMLESVIGSGLDHYDVELRSEGLARIHYIIGLDGAHVPTFDEAALNRRLVEMVRGWDEALEAELAARVGHTRAARIALAQTRIFSTSYRAQFSATEAADDVLRLSLLTGPGAHAVHIYRRIEDPAGQLRIKIYHLDTIIPLSDAVPVLERFGFRVIEEYPFDVDTDRRGWIHDFLVELPSGQLADAVALDQRIAPALKAVLDGEHENDSFNALVITAGLEAQQVAGFRALYRYMRQTGASYTEATVVDALRRHPAITRDLVALFRALHDPSAADAGEADAARKRIAAALERVELIDDDRVLAFYLSAIEATLRTNAYAPSGREALAFKIDSSKVPGLPAPVPYREIFIYSPRVEGVHLRGGPVARGGIRWSDRRDDFRTEILGLLKAQIVKNAVIVPTGAKGGFFPKLLPPPSDRDAWLAEGAECYRIFIRSLLSITDNIVDGAVVPPEQVVRRDGDDPYLVVAADKGTATFSDIANGIAIERGFWLGDAFASGGSVGYDHKAMGITARGAWVSVTRHFAEMGHDVQNDLTTAIGVGDMSGDVFGNGMLLSKALKLVAAFDHRHIFIDPNPDPARSWEERKRLFELPRSSWADYDPSLISPGGGVYPRTQKSIRLSPEARAALGTDAAELGPFELIQAILRAPIDLLWLGGIGTYIKSETESNAEVGDRANDLCRVDAEDLRLKVIGEGANLGITQAGRIAFDRRGGRINTDFIDNSAGVDTSDHEVNIKIALQPVVKSGALSEAARNDLLEAMTDEVAELVLEDNSRQTQALSLAEAGGARDVPAFMRVIQTLEERRGLDRMVEGLPGDDLLAQRAQAGHGLSRPELAVILSYAKLTLYDSLVASPVVDDPLLERDLLDGMPNALSDRFPDALRQHRLRRELIATTLSNEIINRGGIALPFQLAEEGGVRLANVCGAYVAARALFGFASLWAKIDAMPAGQLQNRLMKDSADGLRTQISDILRCHPGQTLTPSAVVEADAGGVARVSGQIESLLRPEPRAELTARAAELDKIGAPEDIAREIIRIHALDGTIATAALARDLGTSEIQVAEAYTLLGQRLGLDWAKGRAAALMPADPWERLLVATAERDMEQMRFDLIRRVAAGNTDPVAAAETWMEHNPDCVRLVSGTVERAKRGAATTSAMLAHIAAQARAALSH